jgi:hypothetical protein
MQRTNIYLDDRQLRLVRLLSKARGVAVAQCVREAVDAWLVGQDVKDVGEDERATRFGRFLARQQKIADRLGLKQEEVGREVAAAVREVRAGRRARRR